MKNDFFSEVSERRAEAIAEMDAKTFAPLIRNHLVQLFREAYEKDHGLEGVRVGMGTACPSGRYLLAERDDEGNLATVKALDWNYGAGAPMYQEVADFLSAVANYSENYMEMPDIGDITLADLETTRTKKAKVHGPNGLRAQLASSNPGQIPSHDTMNRI